MTPEEREQEQQRRAAAAAVAGGTLVVVGDPLSPVTDVPNIGARAAAAGKILAALVAFLTAHRERVRGWLGEQMRRRTASARPEDIARVISEEEQRGEEFERRAAARIARDVTTALAIPDSAAREGAVRGIMRREARYARQREQAMAARAFAAIDRVVLREQSPTGAFWQVDPTVVEHTAGCLIMGGKFWPWQVLDRVHPPRHAGCPCRLRGYGDAIADGLLAPGQVMDVQTAIRRAAAVVMEGALVLDDPADGEALIEAAGGREYVELCEALLAGGLVTEASLAEAHNIPNAFGYGHDFGIGGRFRGQFHPGAGHGVGRVRSAGKRAVRRAASAARSLTHPRKDPKVKVAPNPAYPNAEPRFDEESMRRYELQQQAAILADPGREDGADAALVRELVADQKRANAAINAALGADLAKFIDRKWGREAGVRRRLLDGEITIEEAEQEAYEEWQEAESRRLLREVDRERDYGLNKKPLPCFSCGSFKARPSDICTKCGDDPVQVGTSRSQFDRDYGYGGHDTQPEYWERKYSDRVF